MCSPENEGDPIVCLKILMKLLMLPSMKVSPNFRLNFFSDLHSAPSNSYCPFPISIVKTTIHIGGSQSIP